MYNPTTQDTAASDDRALELERIFAALNDSQAIIEFEPDGRIITANTNFLGTVGYTLAEIQGKHHRMFVPSDIAQSADYQAFWNTLGHGDFITLQCRRKTREQREIWLQASYCPITDNHGTVIKIVKVASDITAERKAQDDLQALITEAGSVMSAVATGDLTHRMSGHYKPDLAVLADSINHTIEQLSNTLFTISQNAQTLRTSSDQMGELFTHSRQAANDTAEQTLQVADATRQISTSVDNVVDAMAEMSTSVQEIATNSSEAATVAEKAVELAGNARVNVKQLAESSKDISAVIKVINSIADQTNLLALNATIEAARAGDAGKGFAVVANEVKELAKETAKATDAVRAKISTIQNESQVAVKAINDIGSTIENISSTQSSIADTVQSQSAVSNVISQSVKEVSFGSTDIGRSISHAADVARTNQTRMDDSQVIVAELSELAMTLNLTVSQFKLKAA